MNAQLYGADLDRLSDLRAAFDRSAAEVRTVTASATEGTASLTAYWHGSDAAEFRHRWITHYRPVMLAAAQALQDAAGTIERNLGEQQRTSEGLPGPGGATGSAGSVGAGLAAGAGIGLGGAAAAAAGAAIGLGGIGQGQTGNGNGSASGAESDGDESDPGGGSPWLDEALDDAGIDLDSWRPELGAEANRDAIIDVYRYYGDLFLADPDLQWAGMANAIGPSFAAGFFDLAAIRGLAGDLENVLDQLPSGVLPVPGEALEALAGITENELRFYETTFLRMQYDIFLDQAPMHEAYVNGGMDAIRQMGEDRLITPDMVDAWALLDEGKRTGDQSLITEANTRFLFREQKVIINDYYNEMYNRFPSGPAFTYLMTMIGTPSIPGASGYAELYPIDVSMETPGPERLGTPSRIGPWEIPHISVDNPLQGTVTVETPFPDGNLASFDDRWRLIEENTLPAYLGLDSEQARDLAAGDVGHRIDEQRLGLDDAVDVITRWDVEFDQ